MGSIVDAWGEIADAATITLTTVNRPRLRTSGGHTQVLPCMTQTGIPKQAKFRTLTEFRFAMRELLSRMRWSNHSHLPTTPPIISIAPDNDRD